LNSSQAWAIQRLSQNKQKRTVLKRKDREFQDASEKEKAESVPPKVKSWRDA
jgi:hypothetical protein